MRPFPTVGSLNGANSKMRGAVAAGVKEALRRLNELAGPLAGDPEGANLYSRQSIAIYR